MHFFFFFSPVDLQRLPCEFRFEACRRQVPRSDKNQGGNFLKIFFEITEMGQTVFSLNFISNFFLLSSPLKFDFLRHEVWNF